MEKSAALAPMHIASVSATVSENALFFQSRRRPTRMSESIRDIDERDRPQVQRYGKADGVRAAAQVPGARFSFCFRTRRAIVAVVNVHRTAPGTDLVRVKRVYESPSDDDGVRVLVDRIWPRGLSKHQAAVDLWLKD